MKYIYNVLALIGFALVLAGCQTAPPNPVATAERPETVGLALYGSFVIAEEFGAGVAEDANTPPEVKAAIKAADVAVSPVAEQAQPIVKEVEKARADITAGGGSKNLLDTAVKKLNDWVTQAAGLIKNFTDAVRKARAGPSPTSTSTATGDIHT